MFEIFKKTNCDRCNAKLEARIQSWFNNEVICMDCSSVEDDLKQKLTDKHGTSYEGCGFPLDQVKKLAEES